MSDSSSGRVRLFGACPGARPEDTFELARRRRSDEFAIQLTRALRLLAKEREYPRRLQEGRPVAFSDDGGVTGPAPLSRMPAQAAPDRVEDDVPRKLEEVRVALD
jgi:hypothetical protein